MTPKFNLLDLEPADKLDAVQTVAGYFLSLGLKIVDMDLARPWGFYFYFDPAETDKFVDIFFADSGTEGIDTSLTLQPKVLVFEPNKQNSWQYHHRRAEIWRVITPHISVVMSKDDTEPPAKLAGFGDVVTFAQGMRHRGGAPADEWAAVAEIWQHTNADNLSDEEDIVRLADDFGRADS